MCYISLSDGSISRQREDTACMFRETLWEEVVLAMAQYLENTNDYELNLDNFLTNYKLLAHMKDNYEDSSHRSNMCQSNC